MAFSLTSYLPKCIEWIKIIHIFNLKCTGHFLCEFDIDLTAGLRTIALILCMIFGFYVISMNLASDHFSVIDKVVSLVNLLTNLAGIIKLAVFSQGKKRLKDVTNEVFHPDWKVKDSHFLFLVMFYYQSIVGVVILWGLSPLILGIDVLPFPVWTPFQHETYTIKICKYIFLMLLIIVIATTNLAGDVSYMLIASLICQKAKVARNELISCSEQKRKWNVDSTIRNFVKSHVDILRTVSLLEQYMNILFLLQVVATTLMVCLITLSLDEAEGLFDLIKLAVAGAVVLFELCLFCIFGQSIHDELELLHMTMFWTDWTTYSLPQKKSMLICQAYTCKELWLKGGAIINVSLRTLLASVKESMSYFMFLRTVINKHRLDNRST